MSNSSYETDIQQFWKENNVYKLISEYENNSDRDVFDFMDGPPYVNGQLHTGHLFIAAIKDTILRYKRMHGKQIKNKLGFDTHGLPTESACMKRLNLNTSCEIETYGIANFNEECIKMINEFSDSWEPIYDRCGRWCDFNDAYKTLDKDFMESVWWSFKCLDSKGLIYQGHTVMPYSWKLETPLSNFEAGQNYKEIDTTSVYVTFDMVTNSTIKFVAWTTTPWTLPSNFALCVNPNANYLKCTCENGLSYIVGENYVKNIEKKFEFVAKEFYSKGKDLVGIEYVPLFDFLDIKYHKVLADLYVKDSDTIGTGIVHIAPAFGNDDCRVCRESGCIDNKILDQLCPIDSTGNFKEIIEPYAGINVFDANKLILKDLTNKGYCMLTQQYRHQYPYCERTNTPLIYKTCSSVFVEVVKIRQRMIELNDKIVWAREEIGQHRFKNWLEQTRDWSLSRNRNFGTPIPIWQTEDETESIVIGSIAELVELANLQYIPDNLHTHHIDHITITSKVSGKTMRRISAVFDCWYESGSVPFAKLHYPFENSTYFDNKEYLSDFVAEGIDQTRGWFYTLLVLSTALFDKPPFKHCICSGLVLDENGVKISKKFGNFIDPNILINEYGSDVLRLYLEKSPLSVGQELFFNLKDVKEIAKKLIPCVNGVDFFVRHMDNAFKHNITNIKYIDDKFECSNVTDQFILERISDLRNYVELHTELYHVDKPVIEILNVIDDITNWYIKFNRLRMKGKFGINEQSTSLSVLFTVLYEYFLISAPFMPFLSEHIYLKLKNIFPNLLTSLSIHMLQYPTINRNYGVKANFKKLQTLCALIRSIRNDSTTHNSIKVPVELCVIYEDDPVTIIELQKMFEVIEDEVNCSNFVFKPIPKKIYSLKPNFAVLGKKYKKDSQKIGNIIKNISSDEIELFLTQKPDTLKIVDNENIYELYPTEFEVLQIKVGNFNEDQNVVVKESDQLMIAVDLTISEEGMEKYIVKCFHKEIQNIRKIMELKQWETINVSYYTNSEKIKMILTKYHNKLLEFTSQVKFEQFVDTNVCIIDGNEVYIKIGILV